MTLAMAVLLTACGSDPAPQKTTSSGSGVVGAAEKAPEMPTAKVGGKTLVVYYSGTGRTRTAAEAIAAATQGALFELVPQHGDDLASGDLCHRLAHLAVIRSGQQGDSTRQRIHDL